jgi:hypothetical protein
MEMGEKQWAKDTIQIEEQVRIIPFTITKQIDDCPQRHP